MPTIVVALPDEEPQVLTVEPPGATMVVQSPPEIVTIVTGLQGPPGPAGAAAMPIGGVAGAYLAKASTTDFDAEWRTDIKAPIVIDAGLL